MKPPSLPLSIAKGDDLYPAAITKAGSVRRRSDRRPNRRQPVACWLFCCSRSMTHAPLESLSTTLAIQLVASAMPCFDSRRASRVKASRLY